MSNISVNPSSQITITFAENVPGVIGQVAGALAEAGVNIEAVAHTVETAGDATFRIVVDKQDAAKKVITSLGHAFAEEEIVKIIASENQPGVLAAMGKALGEAGINIEDIYYTSHQGQGNVPVFIQVQSSDVSKAVEVLSSI